MHLTLYFNKVATEIELMSHSKIDVLKETTVNFPAHVYYVRGDRLVAFCPDGNDDAYIVYDTPMRFSKRYRKFQKIATVSEL